MDVKPLLNNVALYNKYYINASHDRKLKIDSFINISDKAASLGAEVLLYKAIKIVLGSNILQRDLTYIYNEYGRPSLKDFPQFFYNISHSGNIVFLCTAPFKIGCDIEVVDDSLKDLNDYYKDMIKEFCEEEQKSIHNFNDFMNNWVKKEATLKAMGVGLGGVDLRHFNLNKIIDYKEIKIAISEIAL